MHYKAECNQCHNRVKKYELCNCIHWTLERSGKVERRSFLKERCPPRPPSVEELLCLERNPLPPSLGWTLLLAYDEILSLGTLPWYFTLSESPHLLFNLPKRKIVNFSSPPSPPRKQKGSHMHRTAFIAILVLRIYFYFYLAPDTMDTVAQTNSNK